MSIEPSASQVYFANRSMTIYCRIDPIDVIMDNLITGIEFTVMRPIIPKTRTYELTINGSNLDNICVKCSHIMLKTVSKCFSYYSKPFQVI